MVKYITSAFSMGMIEEFPVFIAADEITKEEFDTYAVGGQSRILHEDLAEKTGYRYNKKSINARYGDTILVVQEDFDGSLKYHCMEIKSPFPKNISEPKEVKP